MSPSIMTLKNKLMTLVLKSRGKTVSPSHCTFSPSLSISDDGVHRDREIFVCTSFLGTGPDA